MNEEQELEAALTEQDVAELAERVVKDRLLARLLDTIPAAEDTDPPGGQRFHWRHRTVTLTFGHLVALQCAAVLLAAGLVAVLMLAL